LILQIKNAILKLSKIYDNKEFVLQMKAIISVIGVDKVGIIAKVSNALYEMGINIEDISQTIMQDRVFTMTMMIGDTDDTSMKTLNEKMQSIAKEMNVDIRLQQEDIFLSMHRI